MAVFKNGRVVGYTVYFIGFETSDEMLRAEQRVVSRREVFSSNSLHPYPSSVRLLWNTVKNVNLL